MKQTFRAVGNKLYFGGLYLWTSATAQTVVDLAELANLEFAKVTKERNLGLAIDSAAEKLPPGWEILLAVERKGGSVQLFDPTGDEIDYPSNHECQADEVLDAIEEATLIAQGAAR